MIRTYRAKRSPKPSATSYLRCPTCGLVDRSSFWNGRGGKCLTPTCGTTESDLLPATVEEFRAFLNKEDEQPAQP
jgi:hypothetical protein